jgi:membrane protein DedA with SNARE-associated domain
MGFEGFSEAVLAFVREHRVLAPAIVMGLAFGESLAFVSLILPFWGMLVALGALAGASGGFDFWALALAATVGAALGDWVSYWLGYYYHDRIARLWPLNRHPDLLPKGHAFFERWGVWAIVIGRFSGPLRASVPIVAGIVQMPSLTFQIANWGSALLWSFVLLQFGDTLGRSYQMILKWFGGA